MTASGAFSITGLLSEPGPSPNTYTVVARGPGNLGDSKTGVTVTGTSTTSGVTLTLTGDATVSGKVTDATSGAGISGVTVRSEVAGNPVSTTTGSGGTYTLKVTPASQVLTFTAPGTHYEPATRSINPGSGQSVTENVALTPRGSVSATLEDTAGTPLATEPLQLVESASTGGGTTGVAAQIQATNATGVATFKTLAPGNYAVHSPGTEGQHTLTIGVGRARRRSC